MRDELPPEIQSLIAQCEANVISFDNNQMSEALYFAEKTFQELETVREQLVATRRERNIALGWYRIHESLCELLGCQQDASPNYMLGEWRKAIESMKLDSERYRWIRESHMVSLVPEVVDEICDKNMRDSP